jgi:fumarate reductase flavoprotein subunit
MKQINVDVGVIAAGPAGLAAAVAAAEKGASVAVFEKGMTSGGLGNMAMGPFGVESKLQKKQIIGLTRDEAFRIHMDYNHWAVDAQLVRAYIDKSGDTIDWLMGMGVKFVLAARHFPLSQPTWHLLDASTEAQGSARGIVTTLHEKATEFGVKFYFSTPGKKLLKKDGKVVGFTALEEETGDTIQVNAKATIVATGGFGANAAMVKKYTGFETPKDVWVFPVPGIEGDGLRMAWEAGAAASHMIIEMFCAIPNMPMYWNLDALLRQPNLMVNLSGERFFNEDLLQNNTFAANAVLKQKNSCAFMIFDEEAHQYYLKNGFDHILYDVPIADATGFKQEMERAMTEDASPDFFAVDSIEELAQKTGINLPNLKRTIETYNHACETRDAIFNKDYRFMKPIRTPKFYAGRRVPGGFGTLGGIKINYKTEVLNKEFEVIPGFYAAGTDANSIHADCYTFILPGGSLGFALNSGRMAGENATTYVKAGT